MDVSSIRPVAGNEFNARAQDVQVGAARNLRTTRTAHSGFQVRENDLVGPSRGASPQGRAATALQKLADAGPPKKRDLKFSIDDVTGRIIVRVIDPESGEVTRQIPPEDVLKIARKLAQGKGSLLLDRKA